MLLFSREKDPIFKMATPLLLDEVSTTTKLFLTKEVDKKENPSVSNDPDTKESLDELKNKLKAELENFSSSELLDYLKSKPDLQPFVRLLDITSEESLIRLNAEKLDTGTYIIKSEDVQIEKPKLTGWYGKGCAKWKKNRKRSHSCKRQKTELEVVDSTL